MGKSKFEWGKEQQEAFNEIDAAMIRETMLTCPAFLEIFCACQGTRDY